MTPDEALRHEWIQSAQKTSDLRHSQSEASVSRESHSHHHSTSGSGESNYLRVHHKYAPTKTSDKIKAKIIDTRLADSTSLDSNLNDSGTFLPPIL